MTVPPNRDGGETRELERLREIEKAAARHVEDCCRTDIDWRAQMRSHDALSRALTKAKP